MELHVIIHPSYPNDLRIHPSSLNPLLQRLNHAPDAFYLNSVDTNLKYSKLSVMSKDEADKGGGCGLELKLYKWRERAKYKVGGEERKELIRERTKKVDLSLVMQRANMGDVGGL